MEIQGPGSALATQCCLDRGALWKGLGSAPMSENQSLCQVSYSGLNGSFFVRCKEEAGALLGLLNPKKLQQFSYIIFCVHIVKLV